MDFVKINNIKSRKEDYYLNLLKQGIWLYFFLLIFEGALRKWIFPFLSGPLLLVRDPLAFIILFLAYKKGFLKFSFYLVGIFFIGFLSIITTLVVGHGNIWVCIYGARIILLHFPLIFVIGNIFDESDVIKVGRVLLFISIPMTILMALQFYSPQSAWVNRGIGGEGGAGFNGGALGYFRPPGTFSFISGLTQFYGIVTCFVLYFWSKPNLARRTILVIATICVFAAIPFSISRTLFFQTIISVLFFLIAVSRNPRNIPKVFFGTLGTILILVLLASTSLLEKPLEAFTVRFEGANKSEGGLDGVLIDRYLGSMVNSVSGNSTSSFFGSGLGIGTNAGSQLVSNFNGINNWREDEWLRIVYESGLLLGLAIILLRVTLAIDLAFSSFKSLNKGNILPWLLLSFCLVMLPNGQWGQPTGLGFAVFVTGILMASFNKARI